jgi:hypothetical protein
MKKRIMGNLIEAVVGHQQAAATVFDEKLEPAIRSGDAESARDYAIEVVRKARPALALIEVLKAIHGEEKDDA